MFHTRACGPPRGSEEISQVTRTRGSSGGPWHINIEFGGRRGEPRGAAHVVGHLVRSLAIFLPSTVWRWRSAASKPDRAKLRTVRVWTGFVKSVRFVADGGMEDDPGGLGEVLSVAGKTLRKLVKPLLAVIQINSSFRVTFPSLAWPASASPPLNP